MKNRHDWVIAHNAAGKTRTHNFFSHKLFTSVNNFIYWIFNKKIHSALHFSEEACYFAYASEKMFGNSSFFSKTRFSFALSSNQRCFRLDCWVTWLCSEFPENVYNRGRFALKWRILIKVFYSLFQFVVKKWSGWNFYRWNATKFHLFFTRLHL